MNLLQFNYEFNNNDLGELNQGIVECSSSRKTGFSRLSALAFFYDINTKVEANFG